MEIKNQNRKQLEALLIEKAMKDETFRKQILENPKGVIENEAGVKLPDKLRLHIVEETAGQVFLVLSPKPVEASGEALTEEELESVVGGTVGAETVETHWTYCNC